MWRGISQNGESLTGDPVILQTPIFINSRRHRIGANQCKARDHNRAF